MTDQCVHGRKVISQRVDNKTLALAATRFGVNFQLDTTHSRSQPSRQTTPVGD